MPGRQVPEGVHAHQQAKTGIPEFRTQRYQGVEGVGRPVPLQLARVDAESGMRPHGCLQHGHTLPGGGVRSRTVRRNVTGNQPDLLQRQRLLNFQRRAQVTEMDRIEGSPQDADHAG